MWNVWNSAAQQHTDREELDMHPTLASQSLCSNHHVGVSAPLCKWRPVVPCQTACPEPTPEESCICAMPVAPHHTLRTRMVWTSLPFCPGVCASRRLSLCRGGNSPSSTTHTYISIHCHVFLPSIPCTAAWPGEAEESWGRLANHISRKVQLINLSFCCYSWGEAGLGEMENFHKPRSAKLGQMLSTLSKCS